MRYITIGDCPFFKQEKYDEADKKFETAGEINPDNQEIYNNWGLSSSSKKNMMKLERSRKSY